MSQFPQNILMVEPLGFRVAYAINPHMYDSDGRLHEVNMEQAISQWTKLRDTFQDLGLKVTSLPGDPRFPDMVFCANPTFPYKDEHGRTRFLLSHMRNHERKGEVALFEQWAEKSGYLTTPPFAHPFEGSGDAIWDYFHQRIFFGFGFRSDSRAASELARLTGVTTIPLKLIHPSFYHLDTCFAVLDAQTACFVESAFDPESREVLKRSFQNLISLDLDEALHNFAGNCVALRETHVILQKGSTLFCKTLHDHGFEVIELDTSEFIKAGGSVFCMKQLFHI